MEHPVVGERAPSLLCAIYGVEASGFLPATVAMTHPTNKVRCVMRPQALAQSLPPQGTFHRFSCETPRYCVCVCVFIKLHIITQSDPVILVIPCHSH